MVSAHGHEDAGVSSWNDRAHRPPGRGARVRRRRRCLRASPADLSVGCRSRAHGAPRTAAGTRRPGARRWHGKAHPPPGHDRGPHPGARARRQGCASTCARLAPEVELLDGTAEAIPLPGGSVDAVVVAQAFHWFDPVRALSEIHRVLRPGGTLALAWNFRDESVPWVAELGRLIHGLAGDSPRARGGRWRGDLATVGLFAPWTSVVIPHTQVMTPDDVLARVGSVSFVAAAPAEARAALRDQVAALLASHPDTAGRASVELPYESEVMWAARRTLDPGASGIVVTVQPQPRWGAEEGRGWGTRRSARP